jgi:hypothetical protein
MKISPAKVPEFLKLKALKLGFPGLSTTRPSRNQKGPGLSGKLQITNKGEPFGQILDAFGGEHNGVFYQARQGCL